MGSGLNKIKPERIPPTYWFLTFPPLRPNLVITVNVRCRLTVRRFFDCVFVFGCKEPIGIKRVYLFSPNFLESRVRIFSTKKDKTRLINKSGDSSNCFRPLWLVLGKIYWKSSAKARSHIHIYSLFAVLEAGSILVHYQKKTLASSAR